MLVCLARQNDPKQSFVYNSSPINVKYVRVTWINGRKYKK